MRRTIFVTRTRDAAVASLKAEYPQHLDEWMKASDFLRIHSYPGLHFDMSNLGSGAQALDFFATDIFSASFTKVSLSSSDPVV